MNSTIMMTTGFDFQGYNIKKYIGICSGECALGTGFLSSLEAGFADFLGSNSSTYSDKLRGAKEYALDQLVNDVKEKGGNAIIGLSINYATFSADIMGVIATGTAVIIEPVNSIHSTLTNYDKVPIHAATSGLTFCPQNIYVTKDSNVCDLSLEIFCTEQPAPLHILADISTVSFFDEIATYSQISFLQFKEVSTNLYLSHTAPSTIPCDILYNAKQVNVRIKKYVLDNNVICIGDQTLSPTIAQIDKMKEDLSLTFNKSKLITALASLNNAGEVYKYVTDHQREFGVPAALILELESLITFERLYGSMKESAIKKISEYEETL